MSFWENNKGSIKSGGLAVLKGAGKATSATAKAGYSAYKSHNNKKAEAKAEEEEEAMESGSHASSLSYRDPRSFPPPPHHVGAGGAADPYPGAPAQGYQSQYPGYSQPQQPTPPTPSAPAYGQQTQAYGQYGQYGQERQPSSTPAAAPYGQTDEYGRTLPPAPYGQQPQQPSPVSTPYGQPPAVQYGQQQQPPVNPYGQQPPPGQYGQQEPPMTQYGQQPQSQYGQQPQSQYGQQPQSQYVQPPQPNQYEPQPPVNQYGQQPLVNQYGQQPAAPYGQQSPTTSSQFGQPLPRADSYGQLQAEKYGQQQPQPQPSISAYGQQPPANQYGQQQPPTPPYSKQPSIASYPQQEQVTTQQMPLPQRGSIPTPPDILSYNNPYHPATPAQSEPPMSVYPGQQQYSSMNSSTEVPLSPQAGTTPHIPSRPLPPALSSTNSYQQQQTSSYDREQYDPSPPYGQQQMPPPPARNEQPQPTASTYGQYNQAPAPAPAPAAPPRNSYYPAPPSRSTTSEALPPSRVETNVGLNERGQAPGKPGEETIVEPQFKTNLMDFDLKKFGAPPPRARLTKDEEMKAERRKADAYRIKQIKEQSLLKARETAGKNISPYGSVIPSNNASTEQINNLEAEASHENSYLAQDIPGTPGISERLGSETADDQPTPFNLPDITQFQPPPLAHQKKPIVNSELTSPSQLSESASNPYFEKQKPPKPAKKFRQEETVSYSEPAESQTPSIYARPAMSIPASPSFDKPIKKTPPPKPAKHTDLHSKSKKVPPPKPAKLSKPIKPAGLSSAESEQSGEVESSAKGNHIRELQARLGNLGL